ncbi:MAG TPA: class I adenylate-forming enzyme family protein [Mycobacteriales bacterium]|nr:class I adenylate-forming enzyme family protein [Mycobacteriales bacterium]
MTVAPPLSLVAWLDSVVAAHGRRVALADDGVNVTYDEMWATAGGVANYLRTDLDAELGARIAIIGTNQAAYIEAFLGILRGGLVAVPLNPMLDTRSLRAQLEALDASILILGEVDDDVREGLCGVLPIVELPRLLADSEAHFGKLPLPRPASPACIIPTSGSTGLPKGALHTQSGLLHCALQIGGALPLGPSDRNVSFLPFFAAIPEQVLPTLCAGGAVEVIARFDVERIAAACARATCFDAVPTIMSRLINEAPLESLRQLNWVYFASEPMPPALLARWHEELPGVETHQFYGMTELVPATVASHRILLTDRTTVGVPFPTTRVTRDPESGELFTRSPAQMSGYFNNAAATRAALTPEGAIRTGDVGEFDELGRLHLTSRLKDLIITGGLNVAPSEIEAVACHHPSIGVAAVVGIPDERWGETPIVVGVARDGATVSAADLLAHCRQSLKGFKRPSGAAIVDVLPSTGIGKVAKQLLRDQIVKGEIDLVRAG